MLQQENQTQSANFEWVCQALSATGEPSLRSAAAKPPGERTTPREFPSISVFFFLALLLIN